MIHAKKITDRCTRDSPSFHWAGNYKIDMTIVLSLSLLIIAGFMITAQDLPALSPKPKKVDLYFHGSERPTKLGDYHALLTIKYDGKTVCSDLYMNSRHGFGGVTITNVKEKAKSYVSVKVCDRNNALVGQKS